MPSVDVPTRRETSPRRPLPTGIGRVRWQHPVAAAVLAAVVGSAAVGAGAGLAIRHLQKTGVTVVSVTGLLTLACGLALIGYAAVVGWRALRRWWRALLVVPLLVALTIAASFGQAFMYAMTPSPALGKQTPATVGLGYTDVAFPAPDGVRLSAWYVPSRNRAAVVLRHGSGSTRTTTLRHAAVLARHGYGVLLVDARGHGRSGGAGMDIGWYGDLDIAGCVDFLSERPDVDPDRIGIVGLSMGGEEAIGAAAAVPRIAAVVGEGVTGRTSDDTARTVSGAWNAPLRRAVDRFTDALTDVLSPASRPRSLRDAVRTAHTPFLVIAAGKVPRESTFAADLHRAAPDRVETWTVPDAQHTQGLAVDPAGWESRVIGFLDRHLAPVAASS